MPVFSQDRGGRVNQEDVEASQVGKLQNLVGDSIDVEKILPNGDFVAFNGGTYRLYGSPPRAYWLNNDGEPVPPPQPGSQRVTAQDAISGGGSGNSGGSFGGGTSKGGARATEQGAGEDDVGGVPLTFDYLGGVVDDCLACGLIGELMIAVDGIGTAVTPLLRTAANGLLGAALAVVFMFNIGKLFMPFSMLEASRVIYGRLVSQTGMVLLSTLMLTSFVNYWNIVFVPPVTAGVNYVDQLMEAAREEINNNLIDKNRPSNGTFAFDPDAPNDPITKGCEMQTIGLNGAPQSAPVVTAETLGDRIECLTRDMQSVLAIGLTASISAMLSTVSEEDAGGNAITKVITAVMSFPATLVAIFSGIILFLVYAPVYLSFPLKIVDVVVRWAILGVISPLLIAAFAFPAARHMAFAGLRGLFQSVMELVMIGVAISLGSFTIVAITNGIDMERSSLLINGVLFWRFFFAGLITTMMIGKMKTFAIAFTFPGGGHGMDVGAAGDMGDKMQKALDSVSGGAQKNVGQQVAGDANALGKFAKNIASKMMR